MKYLSRFILKYERQIVLAICLFGMLLRFYRLGDIPYGLNQDEASAGYEAWSLLHYGIDRNGNAWPVLFVAWGSGQNVLYSYLSIPFIALFGLNTFSLRLCAAICGSLSLPLFYGLAKRSGRNDLALWAVFLLAINPWHVLLSRWALESNLLPFMLLLGVYCLVRVEEDRRWLMLSASAFGLSLYAYGTAYIFLPLFLLGASFYLWKNRSVDAKHYIISLLMFVLIALPISLCNLRNALHLPSMNLLGMTLPALTETRQAAVTVLDGENSLLSNFTAFLRLLYRQSDGLMWNSCGVYGLFYGKAGLLLALIGLLRSIALAWRQKLTKVHFYCLLSLLISFLAAFVIEVNVNRINMVFLPIILLQAIGICAIARYAGTVAAVGLLCASLMFSDYYFTDYAQKLSPSFYYGLEQCIEYSAQSTQENETLFISYDVNMPYIYVLFYEQIPPRDYLETATYLNKGGAFEWVSSTDRWLFARAENAPQDGTLCILPQYKTEGRTMEYQCGNWCCVR